MFFVELHVHRILRSVEPFEIVGHHCVLDGVLLYSAVLSLGQNMDSYVSVIDTLVSIRKKKHTCAAVVCEHTIQSQSRSTIVLKCKTNC